MINIQPTGGACGAVVRGIDLSKGVTDEIMSDLTKALYNHRCLIIKNQKITKDAYYQFAKRSVSYTHLTLPTKRIV